MILQLLLLVFGKVPMSCSRSLLCQYYRFYTTWKCLYMCVMFTNFTANQLFRCAQNFKMWWRRRWRHSNQDAEAITRWLEIASLIWLAKVCQAKGIRPKAAINRSVAHKDFGKDCQTLVPVPATSWAQPQADTTSALPSTTIAGQGGDHSGNQNVAHF